MSKKYLVVIWNDINIDLKGPYKTAKGVLDRARVIRAMSDRHGLHKLTVINGEPFVEDFRGADLE